MNKTNFVNDKFQFYSRIILDLQIHVRVHLKTAPYIEMKQKASEMNFSTANKKDKLINIHKAH